MDFSRLKKYDLHCHLDGSLSKRVILKLARMTGADLGNVEDLESRLRVREDCRSLKEYLEKFDLPLSCLTDQKCFTTAVTENTSGIREMRPTEMSSRTGYWAAICFMAERYPSTMAVFRVIFTSAADSERMLTNTSTVPREMLFFTDCFTASSAKDTLRGSFTVQAEIEIAIGKFCQIT